jgi:hypothetical protein
MLVIQPLEKCRFAKGIKKGRVYGIDGCKHIDVYMLPPTTNCYKKGQVIQLGKYLFGKDAVLPKSYSCRALIRDIVDYEY